jgi:hypothetical protein
MTLGAMGCVERWRHIVGISTLALVASLGLVLAMGAATATPSSYGYDRSSAHPAAHANAYAARSSPRSERTASRTVSSRGTSVLAPSAVAAEGVESGGTQAAETVRRFVRQDEFDAIQKALSSGEKEVQVGRFFTPDAITSPSVAAQQLALPGTDVNPLVGYFDVPASSLPSEPFATFGPRLVQPDFFQPGFGLEIEVSELYGRPVVPTSGLRLVGF